MANHEDSNNSDDGFLKIHPHLANMAKNGIATTVKTISTKSLIRLVQSQPSLWDRTSMQYKEKTTRERAWLHIIKELFPQHANFTKSQMLEIMHNLTHRWYNVRDAYVKCRKRKVFNKPKKPYIYSDLLAFLDPIHKLPADNSSTVEYSDDLEYLTEEKINDSQFEGNHEDEITIDEQVIGEEYLDTYLDESEATPAKRLRNDPLDENVISVLANLLEKEDDEDRAFFKSIIPSVKALNRDAKIEFRIQVMKLLKNLSSSQKRKRVKIEVVNNDSD